MKLKIILGSGSKRRAQILKELGYDFEILVSNVDEQAIRVDDLQSLPLTLALAKSEVLKNQISGPAILVTADSIVVHDGIVKEKPAHENEAREFLQSYGAKPVEVITAVVAVNTATGKIAKDTESARVYFHKIPEATIEELIKHGAIMDAAGAFIADMPAIRKYIVHIDGNMDTVMGLPKMLTKKLIEEVRHES